MDKLIKDLRSDLLGNPDVSIIKTARWQLPAVSYEVTFSQVKRFKMDILMKMLLFAFQETDIRRAAALADMLLVEELFIRDLIGKMERTQLIHLGNKGYMLTPKGHEYLGKGIFEEDMEEGQALVAYSAVHDEYRLADGNEAVEGEGTLPVYRYAVEGTVDWDRLQELLAKEEFGSAEDDFQTIVTDIVGCEEHSAQPVPCVEFQLYDRKQDIFYARVWSGLAGGWDEKLEKQIEEKEVVKWRADGLKDRKEP
ncbi:hypothetical protein [Planomicrobium sp. CPCC 101110]|uniref:hypothetical protein n=1 Tax=Planomicrobium sp. CPCC 101110 TaxID=2599619 RepID=UPI0011B7EAC7|nr:hypothetical protein [Planomicrobium sp. CPCC 101110]TWT25263.1 hypothetical protein FQV30_12930 [Planomicrobium sp. CPCC 101110]